MRLNTTPRINDADAKREFRDHAALVNLISDGRLQGVNNASTAAPTTGTHAVGDFVRNSAPAEAGVVSAKYVIFGWVCSVGGSPGTWLQCRFLTGN